MAGSPGVELGACAADVFWVNTCHQHRVRTPIPTPTPNPSSPLLLPPSPTHTPHHHHHHHHQAFSSGQLFCVNLAKTLAVAMSERDGAAKRRRERRLRSWAKHERQTVAMALAEALHHSAPRSPKTARAGVRPGVLEDPGPRRETEHEQHAALRGPKPPSPGVPLLAMPVLAGTAGEAVDRTALSYLLQQSLAATKEEEERKLVELEVKRKEAELQSLAAATREMVQQRAVGSSAWTSTLARKVQLRDELRELRGEKRKKRKKRKKKLPKTSSGYGRPVLRQCGGHSCYACRNVYPQCVLCRRLSRFYRCCSWTVPPPDIGGVGFGSSPNLVTYHTFYELSLPSERGCPDSAALRAARVFAPLCRVMVAVLSRWCLRFYLGQCYADYWKIHRLFFPVPRGRWGVCLLILVQQQRRDLR